MESTIHPSHPIDSISRKRAREEEEDLSADIPPQKRIRSQETASLESTGIAVADPDQPRLTLSPPPEPCLRYETPSPETIPATLPSTSDVPARYKRRREDSEFDTAAPSKRRNVAQKAVQTLTVADPDQPQPTLSSPPEAYFGYETPQAAVQTLPACASWAELFKDAPVYGARTWEDTMINAEPMCDAPYGGESLVYLSSAPPSSALSPSAPLSSALSSSSSQFGTSTICDNTYRSTFPEDENTFYGDEIENEVVADTNPPQPIFKPTPIRDWKIVPIKEDWLAENDPPMRYSASGRCYVRLTTVSPSPLGPHFGKRNPTPAKLIHRERDVSSACRISVLTNCAYSVVQEQETKQRQMDEQSLSPRCPPTPPPPPQLTFSPAPADQLFQAGTPYTSASSSIQLDADLEVPASWEQTNQQRVCCGGCGGYGDCRMDCPTAVQPSASTCDTYWSTRLQLDEQFFLDGEHTPPTAVSETSLMDDQFDGSLDFNLDFPWPLEPVQPVLLDYTSSPFIPLHSLSKDSELSAMHGYLGAMQGQVVPAVYLDEDVVETV